MVRSRRKKFSVAGSVFCSTFWGTFNLSTYVGTYRESIIVRLTSCLTGLDSTKLVNLYPIQHKQSSWILIGETGGQPYSDTSPYKVSECSLYLPAYNGTYLHGIFGYALLQGMTFENNWWYVFYQSYLLFYIHRILWIRTYLLWHIGRKAYRVISYFIVWVITFLDSKCDS